MPMYEYRCEACEKNMEIVQKFSDEPLKDCPECGSTKFAKVPSFSSSFTLKGTGWYVTDYKKSSPPKSES